MLILFKKFKFKGYKPEFKIIFSSNKTRKNLITHNHFHALFDLISVLFLKPLYKFIRQFRNASNRFDGTPKSN